MASLEPGELWDNPWDTPLPPTPGLDFAETPPALEDPPTPGLDLGPEVDDSPSILRENSTNVGGGTGLMLPLSSVPFDGGKDTTVRKLFAPEAVSKKEARFGDLLRPVIRDAEIFYDALESPIVKEEPESEEKYHKPIFSLSDTIEDTITLTSNIEANTGQARHSTTTQRSPATVVNSAEVGTRPQTQTKAKASYRPPPHPIHDNHFPLEQIWRWSMDFCRVLPLEAVERLKDDAARCVSTNKNFKSRCSFRSNAKEYGPPRLKDIFSGLQKPLEASGFDHYVQDVLGLLNCEKHRREGKQPLDLLRSLEPEVSNNGSGASTVALVKSARSFLEHWVMTLATRWLCSEENDAVEKTETTKVIGGDSQRTTLETLNVNSAKTEPAVISPSVSTPSTQDIISVKKESEVITASILKTSTRDTCPMKEEPEHITSYVFTGTTRDTNSVKNQLEVLAASILTPLQRKLIEFPWSTQKAQLTPEELIRQLLKQKLTAADMKRTGYIYVYWQPGYFGYVKIGYSNDVDKRLRRWATQCKFVVAAHKTVQRKVPHTHMVESLIHAELKQYRWFEEKCPGCGKSHREWFRANEYHVQQVVEKWTKRSFWKERVLDPELSEAEIDEMCKPIPERKFATPHKMKGKAKMATDPVRKNEFAFPEYEGLKFSSPSTVATMDHPKS